MQVIIASFLVRFATHHWQFLGSKVMLKSICRLVLLQSGLLESVKIGRLLDANWRFGIKIVA